MCSVSQGEFPRRRPNNTAGNGKTKRRPAERNGHNERSDQSEEPSADQSAIFLPLALVFPRLHSSDSITCSVTRRTADHFSMVPKRERHHRERERDESGDERRLLHPVHGKRAGPACRQLHVSRHE